MGNRTLGIVLLVVGILILFGSLLLLPPPTSAIGAVVGGIIAIIGMVLTAQPASPATEEKPAPAAEPVAETEAKAAPAAEEDLTKIEGIGPKLQSILYEAGISTYEMLAAKTPEAITEVVQAGGFKAPFKADSWPQQAELAAKGDWDGLQKLQDELTAGRI